MPPRQSAAVTAKTGTSQPSYSQEAFSLRTCTCAQGKIANFLVSVCPEIGFTVQSKVMAEVKSFSSQETGRWDVIVSKK